MTYQQVDQNVQLIFDLTHRLTGQNHKQQTNTRQIHAVRSLDMLFITPADSRLIFFYYFPVR